MEVGNQTPFVEGVDWQAVLPQKAGVMGDDMVVDAGGRLGACCA